MEIRKRREPLFSRVYIIGAGFSAGLSYPVGSNFMARLVAYLERKSEPEELHRFGFLNTLALKRSQNRADQILSVIRHVMKTYLATDKIEEVNIAEFFSIAHTLSRTPSLFGIDERSLRTSVPEDSADAASEATLFNDLAAATRTYFSDIATLRFRRPLNKIFLARKDTRYLLDSLKPSRDAIISFNWDEEVEHALCSKSKPGVSYTLGDWCGDPRLTYLLLKPHGSVGWYDVKQGIGNRDSYFIAEFDNRIPRSKRKLLAYWKYALPLDVDGETQHPPLSCPPVITAPTFAKCFDYLEQQCVWQDVLRVCSQARYFIFLGYKLPEDDYLTRAALRKAMADRRSRDTLRCVVVSAEDSLPSGTRRVFKYLDDERNFIKWKFGSQERGLVKAIEKKLRNAGVSPLCRKVKPVASGRVL